MKKNKQKTVGNKAATEKGCPGQRKYPFIVKKNSIINNNSNDKVYE